MQNDPSSITAVAGQQKTPTPAGETTTAPARSTFASLYVGDLSPDVTESLLYEAFREIGNILSIRVCRDSATRYSLGYAYVNFSTADEADKAIDTLNYSLIKGQPIRIMWSRRDPSLRRSNVGNIFIKNLPKHLDNLGLYDIFCTYGNILSCKVQTDSNGESKGFGFVHYETKESADSAIAAMNGMLFDGKLVFVGEFQSKAERNNNAGAEQRFTNVIVQNVDFSITEQEFVEEFSKYGKVTSGVLMSNSEAPQHRGFGFCNFETHEQAVAAILAKNETEWKGKKLFVGRAKSKEEFHREKEAVREKKRLATEGCNLYVKNLPDSITTERLIELFKEHGEITSPYIPSENGISKGFAFVCYSKPEEANAAIAKMNGVMVENKPLYVAHHQRKALRVAQLALQHNQRFGANFGSYPSHPGNISYPYHPFAAMSYPQAPYRGGPKRGRIAHGGHSHGGHRGHGHGHGHHAPRGAPRQNPADVAQPTPAAQ